MSSYLQTIARRDNTVVRVADFPGRDAGPELRRLAENGSLLKLAHGYYALVPEARRGVNTSWRPSVEAAALGIAIADYGREATALLGPSAARVLGCYPRALTAAVVAVPTQRPTKVTVAGSVKFVLRDTSNLDLVRTNTELGPGWVTSIEQSLLDLSGGWPRWPISDATRMEMLHLLAAQSSTDLIEKLATKPRRRAAYDRVKELLDDLG